MLDSEAALAVQVILHSHLRFMGGRHLFYLAIALGFGSCVIFLILFIVQIVSCKSEASVLGLVSQMLQGMNIYFAYKMTAAINICVTNHKTLNGLHKLFPGNKRISSPAIEMQL